MLGSVNAMSLCHFTAAYGGEDLREYCQLDTFSPRCRPGDVIVMTTARFGRMRVGKCIDVGAQSTLQRADPHSLGCYADVLEYADRTCSGRSACDIPVPSRELLATRPCFEQLTMYLEAGYTCMSGNSCIAIVNTGNTNDGTSSRFVLPTSRFMEYECMFDGNLKQYIRKKCDTRNAA
jgi:hypothetical protein